MNIDRFLLFKETGRLRSDTRASDSVSDGMSKTFLVSILPDDIVFEIGKRMFGKYDVPRNMKIEKLKNISSYT